MKNLFFALLLLAGTAFAQEDKFIALLKSDASLREKAEACRELAHVGTQQAVPVLAPLLADEQLSHMARFALEPIPDPSVDTALREALGKVKGRLLVGVIHSLAVRKDAQALEPLSKFLADTDPAVAQAAARALGSLGGAAAPVLQRTVSTASPANQLAISEGLLRCAEALPDTQSVAIYDRLRAVPNLPRQVRVAALRGAIRSRAAKGVPLLAEAIRNDSDGLVSDAIRISMEIPGPEMTQALVAELAPANEAKQLLLLQTLGNRGDATAAPALVPLARQGSPALRIAAIRGLVQLADRSGLPVLAALVKYPEAAVSGAAQTGLIGFPGKEADAAVVALLNESDAKVRIAAIAAVGQRRITTAIPALLKAAGETETGLASASFKVLGELAGVADLPGVVEAMIQAKAPTAAETALSAICDRQPDPTICADKLLPGLGRAQGEPKLVLLRVLGTVGGPKALAAVRAAAGEPDPSVKEAALRALCDWPTAEALPEVAQIAQTAADPKSKLLALRGQLRLIPMQTGAEVQKVAQLRQLLPLLEQKADQRTALGALANLPCAESLALVTPYLSGEGLKEEAGVAAVVIAEKIVDRHPAEVADAMKQVQTTNAQLAARLRKVLARVPKGAAEAGFTPIFNGKDLSGWDGKPGWWTVQDGALTAESTPQKPCTECNYLIWRGGQPADFELLADFWLSGAGNSGLQLRSETRPNWDTSGYQADMSGDGALVGFVYEHKRGLIAGRGERVTIGTDGKRQVRKLGDAAELGKLYKKEAWNTYRIICRGPEITLFINGTLMCQFTDQDPKHAAAKGIIALQMHPGPAMKVQFKNLRLKELK